MSSSGLKQDLHTCMLPCVLMVPAFLLSRYEQSEWGWKEREKREEMKDERAWYLLARDAESAPVAFSHFRFDVECGDEVLYWYGLLFSTCASCSFKKLFATSFNSLIEL